MQVPVAGRIPAQAVEPIQVREVAHTRVLVEALIRDQEAEPTLVPEDHVIVARAGRRSTNGTGLLQTASNWDWRSNEFK